MTEATAASPVAPPPPAARFVTGSMLRHVAVMTATGSVGLMAVFVVDLLTLAYVSRLGDPGLTAAIGFATVLMFFAVSINVGLMIAVGALVSREIGAGRREAARRIATSATIHLGLGAAIATAAILAGLDPAFAALGVPPGIRPVAGTFLWIALPANLLMALGMGFSGILRALGDASRAMVVTLAGAVVTAILDPVLIFGLELGIEGAAIATVASRVAFALVGFHGVARVHDILARPRRREVLADLRPVLAIAGPAVLTALAPAVAGAFLAGVLARHGAAAVAGNAVIDRLTPVAFAGLFALSGAVGPILGQNWGAGRFDRMRAALRDGAVLSGLYVAVVWAALVLGADALPRVFGLDGEAAELVVFFCWIGGAVWFFNGLLFVANAAFNNLGFPLLSTAFNWGRATLGTIPFALIGAAQAGPRGALAGIGAGSLLFGVAALLVAFRSIRLLERRAACAAREAPPASHEARGPSNEAPGALRDPLEPRSV